MKLVEYSKKILDYIFPYKCPLCAEFTLKNDGFCPTCWAKLNFISKPYCKICGFKFGISCIEEVLCGSCIARPPKFDNARSLFKFDEHSKKLVHHFKYYDKTELGKIFASLIWRRYGEEFAKIDFIVPVPMHKLKRLFRMYNQAQILGLYISKVSGKSMIPDLLVKFKWTKSQTSLRAKERKKNLSGSLRINPKYSVGGKKILLVDDVRTTGATLSECSQILKKAGAESVSIVTIASS